MRVHAIRLTPGVDLKEELERLTANIPLRAGCILTGVGSLARAHLRMPGAGATADQFRTFDETLEIVSLAGTLSPEGLHVHVSLSRRDGSCVGGHLMVGCIVHTTAELVIGDLPEVEFRRPHDPSTGFGELSVQKSRR